MGFGLLSLIKVYIERKILKKLIDIVESDMRLEEKLLKIRAWIDGRGFYCFEDLDENLGYLNFLKHGNFPGSKDDILEKVRVFKEEHNSRYKRRPFFIRLFQYFIDKILSKIVSGWNLENNLFRLDKENDFTLLNRAAANELKLAIYLGYFYEAQEFFLCPWDFCTEAPEQRLFVDLGEHITADRKMLLQNLSEDQTTLQRYDSASFVGDSPKLEGEGYLFQDDMPDHDGGTFASARDFLLSECEGDECFGEDIRDAIRKCVTGLESSNFLERVVLFHRRINGSENAESFFNRVHAHIGSGAKDAVFLEYFLVDHYHSKITPLGRVKAVSAGDLFALYNAGLNCIERTIVEGYMSRAEDPSCVKGAQLLSVEDLNWVQPTVRDRSIARSFMEVEIGENDMLEVREVLSSLGFYCGGGHGFSDSIVRTVDALNSYSSNYPAPIIYKRADFSQGFIEECNFKIEEIGATELFGKSVKLSEFMKLVERFRAIEEVLSYSGKLAEDYCRESILLPKLFALAEQKHLFSDDERVSAFCSYCIYRLLPGHWDHIKNLAQKLFSDKSDPKINSILIRLFCASSSFVAQFPFFMKEFPSPFLMEALYQKGDGGGWKRLYAQFFGKTSEAALDFVTVLFLSALIGSGDSVLISDCFGVRYELELHPGCKLSNIQVLIFLFASAIEEAQTANKSLIYPDSPLEEFLENLRDMIRNFCATDIRNTVLGENDTLSDEDMRFQGILVGIFKRFHGVSDRGRKDSIFRPFSIARFGKVKGNYLSEVRDFFCDSSKVKVCMLAKSSRNKTQMVAFNTVSTREQLCAKFAFEDVEQVRWGVNIGGNGEIEVTSGAGMIIKWGIHSDKIEKSDEILIEASDQKASIPLAGVVAFLAYMEVYEQAILRMRFKQTEDIDFFQLFDLIADENIRLQRVSIGISEEPYYFLKFGTITEVSHSSEKIRSFMKKGCMLMKIADICLQAGIVSIDNFMKSLLQVHTDQGLLLWLMGEIARSIKESGADSSVKVDAIAEVLEKKIALLRDFREESQGIAVKFVQFWREACKIDYVGNRFSGQVDSLFEKYFLGKTPGSITNTITQSECQQCKNHYQKECIAKNQCFLCEENKDSHYDRRKLAFVDSVLKECSSWTGTDMAMNYQTIANRLRNLRQLDISSRDGLDISEDLVGLVLKTSALKKARNPVILMCVADFVFSGFCHFGCDSSLKTDEQRELFQCIVVLINFFIEGCSLVICDNLKSKGITLIASAAQALGIASEKIDSSMLKSTIVEVVKHCIDDAKDSVLVIDTGLLSVVHSVLGVINRDLAVSFMHRGMVVLNKEEEPEVEVRLVLRGEKRRVVFDVDPDVSQLVHACMHKIPGLPLASMQHDRISIESLMVDYMVRARYFYESGHYDSLDEALLATQHLRKIAPECFREIFLSIAEVVNGKGISEEQGRRPKSLLGLISSIMDGSNWSESIKSSIAVWVCRRSDLIKDLLRINGDKLVFFQSQSVCRQDTDSGLMARSKLLDFVPSCPMSNQALVACRDLLSVDLEREIPHFIKEKVGAFRFIDIDQIEQGNIGENSGSVTVIPREYLGVCKGLFAKRRVSLMDGVIEDCKAILVIDRNTRTVTEGSRDVQAVAQAQDALSKMKLLIKDVVKITLDANIYFRINGDLDHNKSKCMVALVRMCVFLKCIDIEILLFSKASAFREALEKIKIEIVYPGATNLLTESLCSLLEWNGIISHFPRISIDLFLEPRLMKFVYFVMQRSRSIEEREVLLEEIIRLANFSLGQKELVFGLDKPVEELGKATAVLYENRPLSSFVADVCEGLFRSERIKKGVEKLKNTKVNQGKQELTHFHGTGDSAFEYLAAKCLSQGAFEATIKFPEEHCARFNHRRLKSNIVKEQWKKVWHSVIQNNVLINHYAECGKICAPLHKYMSQFNSEWLAKISSLLPAHYKCAVETMVSRLTGIAEDADDEFERIWKEELRVLFAYYVLSTVSVLHLNFEDDRLPSLFLCPDFQLDDEDCGLAVGEPDAIVSRIKDIEDGLLGIVPLYRHFYAPDVTASGAEMNLKLKKEVIRFLAEGKDEGRSYSSCFPVLSGWLSLVAPDPSVYQSILKYDALFKTTCTQDAGEKLAYLGNDFADYVREEKAFDLVRVSYLKLSQTFAKATGGFLAEVQSSGTPSLKIGDVILDAMISQPDCQTKSGLSVT